MMRPTALLFSFLACATLAQAQVAEPKKGAATLIDAAKRLIDGNKGKVDEETRKKAEAAARAAVNAIPEDIKNKAQQLAKDPKAAAARQKALETVQGTMRGGDQPPQPATPAAGAPAAETTLPAVPAGPQPQRLRPLVFERPAVADPTQDTVITATQSGSLDPNTWIGIYRGNVKVRHPKGTIECDELEVHMKKDSKGQVVGENKAPKGGDADILATRSEKNATSKAGMLEKHDPPFEIAYARGTMIRVEMIATDGTTRVATCNEVAIYDNRKDTITLRGMPGIQVGNRLIEATDPRCYIVIDGNGKLQTEGGVFRTILAEGQVPPAPPK